MSDDPDTHDADGVTLLWVERAEQLRAAQALRVRVFCEEQGVPREVELDAGDDIARHAIAVTADGKVVGTMRLLVRDHVVKIGRVAVDREWRGCGIASRLLDRAMEYAQRQRADALKLAAQTAAQRLYLKAGFRPVGEPFDEAGIEHVWMVREVVPIKPARRRPPT
jgi:predicted GNAT family N-acyltransferase